MEEVRLRGADRAAEDSGDLLVRQLMINPKNQRRALLRRQLPNGRAHFRGALVPQQRDIRMLGAEVDAIARLDRFDCAAS